MAIKGYSKVVQIYAAVNGGGSLDPQTQVESVKWKLSTKFQLELKEIPKTFSIWN